jgi:hypothetical protein
VGHHRAVRCVLHLDQAGTPTWPRSSSRETSRGTITLPNRVRSNSTRPTSTRLVIGDVSLTTIT